MSEHDRTSDNNDNNFSYMQNRELSWLEFNKRVLDQGADPGVPLFDRLSFVSIFWSNLQEFFMIRVGSLTDLSFVKKTIIDSKSGMTPAEQLSAIYKRCHELYPYYEQCYKNLRKEFAKNGILNTRGKNLTADQLSYIEDYFYANVMPFLSPSIINSRHPFPHLENGSIYVVVRLDEEASKAAKKKAKAEAAEHGDKSVSGKVDKAAVAKDGKGKDAKNVGADGVTLGIIPLPRQCSRVIRMPGEGMQFMLLEHVIEMFVDKVYSMYRVKHTNVVCVTRNADLDATEGAEEQGEDYREHIKRILKKRTRLAPVRLESERELSATVKAVLLERLNLKEHQTFVTSVPLDMSYTWGLPSMVDAETRSSLSLAPFSPQWPSTLDRRRSIIEQVCEREVLLSYPYESMDAFVQLLREAAADPTVTSIRITLYRLSKQSHLAEALIAAAENGKEVTAVFELRARFDEANNIEWSQRFEEAGCNVLYGFRDYKVHSKVCCITRQTPHGVQHITQLGTGNYNEKTAKLYTDFSFITTDPRIGRDVAAFFRNMQLENLSDEYRMLWVAPLQIKQNIMAGIDEQISLARAGRPAGLFFKTNSITDKQLIDKIVEASQAGVQCTLLVRGISCIVPGVKGYTDNVTVVSIVGRLLEHSRIYAFGPFDGDCRIYLSSADLMTRNMDKRVEIAWPVLNPVLRGEIIGYIGICMADTAKLRDLLPNKQYTELGFFAKADKKGGPVELFDSQDYLIHEAERKLLGASERLAATQAGSVDATRHTAQAEMDLSLLGEEVSEFENKVEKAEDHPIVQDVNLEQLLAAATTSAVSTTTSSSRDDGASADEGDAGFEGSAGGDPAASVLGDDSDSDDGADEFGFDDAFADVDEVRADGDVLVEVDVLEGGADDESVDVDAAAGMDAAAVEAEERLAGKDADIAEFPHIEGLYEPEHNPEGKFTVPSLDGGSVEVERAGGPIIVGEEAVSTLPQEAVQKGFALNDEIAAQQPTVTQPTYAQPQSQYYRPQAQQQPYQQQPYQQGYPQQSQQGLPQQMQSQRAPWQPQAQQGQQPQQPQQPRPVAQQPQQPQPEEPQKEKKSFFKRLFG